MNMTFFRGDVIDISDKKNHCFAPAPVNDFPEVNINIYEMLTSYVCLFVYHVTRARPT